MKKVNLLSKAEMRKVMGGNAPADGCKDLPDADKALCYFNNCMAGWDVGTHTDQQTKDKRDGCCAVTGAC